MPLLDGKEYPKLNHLNLIIISNYKRYRRNEEHFLSAFWSKMVMGFCISIHLFTLWELIVAMLGLHSTRRYILEQYYYLPIFGIWAGMTYLIHKVTVPNHILREIELSPEEYLQGQKLGWFHLAFSAGLISLFLLLTKPHLVY